MQAGPGHRSAPFLHSTISHPKAHELSTFPFLPSFAAPSPCKSAPTNTDAPGVRSTKPSSVIASNPDPLLHCPVQFQSSSTTTTTPPPSMAFRLSNSVIGILNAITLLLSIPILAGGIWLGHRSDGTECDRYLSAPVIALGAFLLAVSIAGLVGACCRVTWLLWVYLLAMFVLIVVLFGITVFAFVVTHKGAGEAVSGRGYKEYRLGDYSNWLQNRVENSKNWNRIRSCLQDSKVCQKLQDKNETVTQFMASDLSPIESGCCKPPTSCGFTYSGATNWTPATNSSMSADPDCATWNNDASSLCYGCQSCKAGVVATVKKDWKRVAIINIVLLVFIIIVYSVGCCAFRNNRRDNAYRRGWKGAGYAA